MRRKNLLVAGMTAFLLWAFAVVVAYYVVHKPFTPSNVLALGRALAGLGGAGVVATLGTGIGLLLMRSPSLEPVERLVWAMALGLGVVSLTGLALGAVGLLRPWLLWALALVGLASTARTVWSALREAWADAAWRPQSPFEGLLAGYCGLMLALALTWSLTPPTAWDGLVYHLTGPKLYLATGRISLPFDLPYLGFPQLIELLFTWGMGLTGERAAAPIHWFYGLLTTLALVTAGRRWLSDASGWLAAAILLSARSILLLAGWPYVDLALILYTTLAFLALKRSIEGGGKWPAIDGTMAAVSGTMAGLALSTKYTALALLPALVAALLALGVRDTRHTIPSPSRDGTRITFHVLRATLLLCALALITWSPWLLKNVLLTGNPTYPFFFGGVHWDAWRSWWYDRPGTGLAYTAPWRLLGAPWDATIWGVEGGAGYSATSGPLFLALLPLVILAWRRFKPARRRWLRAAAAFCGVLYAFWLWGVARTALLRQTRLLFPAFGLLALIAGAAVEGLRKLPRRPFDLGWLTRAIIVGVLALTLTGTLLSAVRGQPLRVLMGFEGREDFLTRRLGWHCAVIERINRELPEESVVLFLWEPRSYYCEIACRPDALLDRWLHTTHLHGHDAEAIAAAWRAEGITHVLLHRAGYEAIVEAGFDPVTEADRATLARLLTGETTPVADFGDAYELYAFAEGSGR